MVLRHDIGNPVLEKFDQTRFCVIKLYQESTIRVTLYSSKTSLSEFVPVSLSVERKMSVPIIKKWDF